MSPGGPNAVARSGQPRRLLLDFAPKGNHARLQAPSWAGGRSRGARRAGDTGRDVQCGSSGDAALAWVGAPCGVVREEAARQPPQGRQHPCRRGKFDTRPSHPRRGGRKKRWRSRPISRVLSWTVIPLGASSPIRSSNLPGPDAGRAMRSLFGLAPGGVCRAGLLPDSRCALTAPFHPCHALPEEPFGGLLSVALSVGSRRPGVTWHRALWSPDFPRHRHPEGWPVTRLSGRLRHVHCRTRTRRGHARPGHIPARRRGGLRRRRAPCAGPP